MKNGSLEIDSRTAVLKSAAGDMAQNALMSHTFPRRSTVHPGRKGNATLESGNALPHGVSRIAQESRRRGPRELVRLIARKSPGVLSPTSTPPKSANATPKRDLQCPVSNRNHDPIFSLQVLGSWQNMPSAGPDHQQATV